MERTRKPTKAAIAAQEAKLEHDHYALEKALEVFPKTERGDIAKFDPKEAKKQDAKANAVIAYAKQVKDWPTLVVAVDTKIEDQEGFVHFWEEAIRGAGGDRQSEKHCPTDATMLSVDAATELTGFTKQQVSKWAKRLEDIPAYKKRLYGRSYDLAMKGEDTVAKDDRDERSEKYKESRKAKHLEIEEAARSEIRENVVGPFPLIYADPPWKFETYSEKGLSKAPDQHYPTLTYDEIKAFEVDSVSVKDIAHKDAALFLWCTSSNIPMALEVLEAWGFEFKSSAVWVKDKSGTGLVFRNQHEVILYGTKGKMPGPQFQPSSVFSFPRGKHSAKPDEVRKAIEKMYPDFDSRTRLELFARETVAGWTPYGFEAGGKL